MSGLITNFVFIACWQNPTIPLKPFVVSCCARYMGMVNTLISYFGWWAITLVVGRMARCWLIGPNCSYLYTTCHRIVVSIRRAKEDKKHHLRRRCPKMCDPLLIYDIARLPPGTTFLFFDPKLYWAHNKLIMWRRTPFLTIRRTRQTGFTILKLPVARKFSSRCLDSLLTHIEREKHVHLLTFLLKLTFDQQVRLIIIRSLLHSRHFCKQSAVFYLLFIVSYLPPT